MSDEQNYYAAARGTELLVVLASSSEDAAEVFAVHGVEVEAPKPVGAEVPSYTRDGETVAATVLEGEGPNG